MESDRDAAFWIRSLDLQEHPEGGFYKETYRAEQQIPLNVLPQNFGGARNYSTAIYYLLRTYDRSKFHRIRSDELWHFYAGSSLTLYLLRDGKLFHHLLGNDPSKGESLQVLIPANCWFGAKVPHENSFTLAGCTVSPGFDFQDFEFAARDELLKTYPYYRTEIELLT